MSFLPLPQSDLIRKAAILRKTFRPLGNFIRCTVKQSGNNQTRSYLRSCEMDTSHFKRMRGCWKHFQMSR